MVDRAALEMPCPERDPGFESLALRHRNALLFAQDEGAFFSEILRFLVNSFGVSWMDQVVIMSLLLSAYTSKNVMEAIRVWNQVVLEGVAFPQTESLTEETGDAFFSAQSYTSVARDEETGELVGLYILHPNNVGRCGHICNASFAVRRDMRGQRIGEALVRDCIHQSKALGFRILQFNAVVKTNASALRLYQKLGFTQLGLIPGGFRMNDGRYEDIIPHYIELQRAGTEIVR